MRLQVPLKTPDVLSSRRVPLTKVQNQISQTMQAFMKAQRQGFRLEDVGNAPLAKRRRLKRDSLSRSSSSDSSRSSYSHGSLTPTKHLQTMSPMRNSPVRNLSNMSNASSTSQNSTLSQGFTPLKKSVTLGGGSDGGTTSGFFSFREARIAAHALCWNKQICPAARSPSPINNHRKRTIRSPPEGDPTRQNVQSENIY